MDNRRNFYRILRVQPDASQKVIQQSYRSLMQKLRMHPDLGGEQWDAGIVNQAYSTLRDPKKRAAYDVELLGRYNIKILSTGGAIGPGAKASERSSPVADDDNQRIYYRVLQVQPDAELEVIKASYCTLRACSRGRHLELLDDAYAIIRDSALRAEYDSLLRSHSHAASVEKLKQLQNKGGEPAGETVIAATTAESGGESGPVLKSVSSTHYQAAIIHYCKFCKTPYSGRGTMDPELYCRECASPLYSPADVFIDTPRRSLARMAQSKHASCYEFWPGKPIQVSLEDLSPTGLKFSTPQALDINQVIKLDASQFRAVAEVVHCKPSGVSNNIGAKFLAVEFDRDTGNFVSQSV